MCYMVTGYVNKEAVTDVFIKAYKKYRPSFDEIGNTLESTIPSNEIVAFSFTGTIRNRQCDCGTSLGSEAIIGSSNNSFDSADEYLSMLQEFQNCPKIKFVAIFKHFYDGSFEETIKPKIEIVKKHISEIDTEYLAHIQDDVVYKFLFYKKWA